MLIRYREEVALKGLWNSSKVGVPLWAAFAALTLGWFYRAPPPGYAIGALAVVAGIMSVREMQTLGRVCWILLLVGLVLAEFRAIKEDRAENQRQQEQFFDTQRRGFREIAEQAGTNFSLTTKDLKAAIDGLSLNIKVANQTLEQTAPHADLQYRNLSLGGREGPNPASPLPAFASGFPYHFYVLFHNAGNDTATLKAFFGKTYVAKPLDMPEQQSLATRFENDWLARPVKPAALFTAGADGFSELTSEPLTETDVADINSRRKALYYMLRFEFSDRQGVWFSDYCFGIQNPGQYLGLSWPCWVHNRTRYRPTRKR